MPQTVPVVILQLIADGRVLVVASDPNSVINLPGSGFVPAAAVVGTLRRGDDASLVIADDGTYTSLTSSIAAIATPGILQSATQSAVIPALSTANVVLTWPTPWADTNYQAVPTVEGSQSLLLNLNLLGVVSRTATQITIAVQNGNIAAQTVSVRVIGVKI